LLFVRVQVVRRLTEPALAWGKLSRRGFPNVYWKTRAKLYETVSTFMDTLHASDRLTLPLGGLLIIGY